MKIKKAILADVSKILPLFHAYRQFYRHEIDPNAENFLSERLSKNESVIFYAEDESGVLGFTQLYPGFSSRNLGSTWILNDLFVKPEARRKKIAWKLIDESVKHAKETKAVLIGLSTQIANADSQELYKKYGFKKDNDLFHFNLRVE
ncbi:MAG: GNAT family N-acetyltransferase [Bacteriovorax sp.]|nr:GNAT family N-acetyltransferase [Bacteriovorax sp.]